MPHIVGRDEEVDLLSNIMRDRSPHSVINIYGPGGIGKTVVCHKFEEWCRQEGIPYGTVTGSDPMASTIDQMLSQFSEGLKQNVPKGTFDELAREFRDYKAVSEVLDKSGGVDKVFTQGGNLRDPKRYSPKKQGGTIK
jgi:hypothetical protein